MKKIVIYGLGKRFQQLVKQSSFVRNKLETYIIAGFIDKYKAGEELVFCNEKYIVASLEEWTDFSVDGVVITVNKY